MIGRGDVPGELKCQRRSFTREIHLQRMSGQVLEQ